MKQTLLIALFFALFALGCGGDEPAPASADEHAEHHAPGHSTHDHTGHTVDAPMASPEEIAAAVAALPAGTWYCPMHPEEKGDSKGRCSKCNMYYVEKPAEAPAAEPGEAPVDPHAGHNH